jgi:hypothetical protein
MRLRLITGLLMTFGTLLAGPTFARTVPVVVELFTSQGCSSCPPADALLGELARQPNVVALAYHVDYWDELGWKDPFAIPEATQRQQDYVRRLSRAGAFTPHIVVGGAMSLVGSNRAAVTQAVNEDRDALAIVLSASGSSLQVDLPERWNEPLDVYVVSYLSRATTKIGRGENANRTLTSHNIVRSFRKLGTWNGKPQQMKLPLATLPRDATGVAVLLQRPKQGAIAGAATMKL